MESAARRRRLRRGAALLCLGVAACAPTPSAGPAPRAVERIGLDWPELLRLKASRDYFTLRDRLEQGNGASTPPVRFARALVQHAFNQPAAANATIVALLAAGVLPDSLVADLRLIQIANDLRLFEYAAGAAAADDLLSNAASLDTAELNDVRNTRRILGALRNVPPQTSEVRGPTSLRLQRGHVPVLVNDSSRQYVFDTGANLSTLMRSEARVLGLRILPAGVEVGSSTTKNVVADVAVADSLTIGQVHYRHVVFLVLDDEALTFPDGFHIPGIIGFPVIERMGEVRLGAAGELSIPATIANRQQRNLALHELTPLTRVGYAGTPLVCRLDTGAGGTQLYEPFYRRFRAQIDTTTASAVRHMGGAGGVQELTVRVLRHARLTLGDTAVVMDSLDVLPTSIASGDAENYLDCNVGHDILDSFSTYILDFRDMAFLLR